MMIASAIGAATDCKVDWRTPRYTERYEGCKLVSRRPNGRLCNRGLTRLAPCAVKVASTVLRGLGGGNAAWLPDPVTLLPARLSVRTADPTDRGLTVAGDGSGRHAAAPGVALQRRLKRRGVAADPPLHQGCAETCEGCLAYFPEIKSRNRGQIAFSAH